MDIFTELHADFIQQGPGSEESTLRALDAIPDMPISPRILDIGCGPGRQPITLAKQTGGIVIAVDTHQAFLVEVDRRAKSGNLSHRVTAENRTMDDMRFEDGSFDLIWSESAIYIIGFEEGLANWKRLIKSGGYLAVSEACWLTDNPPDKAALYW